MLGEFNLKISKKAICLGAALLSATAGFSYTEAKELPKNEVYLGTNADGINIITQQLLPNSVYKFPLLVSLNSLRPVQATHKDLDAIAVSVRPISGGESIKNARIISENGLGFIELHTGCENYFDSTDVELSLSIQTNSGKPLASTLQKLEVGYNTASDEAIEALALGSAVVVDQNRPIYTEPQLTRISEILNHDPVTFVGKLWNYTNSIDNSTALNMHWNTDSIQEILSSNPDAEIKFLSFPAEPRFEQNGRLEIDTAISPNGSTKPFLYRYVYGNLYKLGYEYDPEIDRIVFSPSQLSTYVLSDRELKLN